ncbi:cell death abnormality protein 1-like [Pomacea canaliculata]|uniref:cell death abnormality protein 1-like n=1 Tax=Pomacea canaliculata TaxID=400727 RepID=UPI000D732EB6|nr:cell death abnormality protein 1-like [Pomacea canaliculata]
MFLFRLVNVSITVDRHPCYRIEKTPSSQSISLSCASTLYGQQVTLEKALTSSDPHENVLNICEVQIWVCRRGFYGDNCLIPCGKCEDSFCDRYNGNCRFSRCQPGYHGNICIDKCEAKRYGENCSLPCGHCANNATCHHVTGTCPGHCTPGLTCITGNNVEYFQLS